MADSRDEPDDEVQRVVSRELVRPRPERRGDQDRTRVVLVRQPVKDVSQEVGRDSLIRYIIVAFALVVLLGSMLIALGALGATLGFEDALGLPRRHINLTTSFIEGTATVAAIPSIILNAGESAVLLPVLGLISVGIPAALLALARPRIPGARPSRPGIRALSATGAVIAVCVAVAAVVWCVVPWRVSIVEQMDTKGYTYLQWRSFLELISGIDTFVFVSLVLWCVLGFRFPLPRWGRAFTTVILLAATATIFVAMSTSTGTTRGLDAKRPLVAESNGLLLGEVGSGRLVATVVEGRVRSSIETGSLNFIGRSSLDKELRQASTSQGPVPGP